MTFDYEEHRKRLRAEQDKRKREDERRKKERRREKERKEKKQKIWDERKKKVRDELASQMKEMLGKQDADDANKQDAEKAPPSLRRGGGLGGYSPVSVRSIGVKPGQNTQSQDPALAREQQAENSTQQNTQQTPPLKRPF